MHDPMGAVQRFSMAGSTLCLTALVLLLTACSTKGHLGLVTSDSMDSALLLKGGSTYRVLSPASGSACSTTHILRPFHMPGNDEPRDNFAEAVKMALRTRGADALVDVTIETHRGNYFPVMLPTPLFGVFLHNWQCTTVSGTAIKFVEEPWCSPCLVTRQTKMLPESVATADSMQPSLQWKPFEEARQDVTYDLKVWVLRKGRSDSREGTTVYEWEGLTATSHRIETALEPSTHYFWAVRARTKSRTKYKSQRGATRERMNCMVFTFGPLPPLLKVQETRSNPSNDSLGYEE